MKPTSPETVSDNSATQTNGSAPGASPSKPSPKIVYGSEAARIEWKLGAAVEELEVEMPKEAEPLRMRAIAFDEEHEARGLQAIFDIGRAEAVQGEWLLVPERTLFFLDKLGIPYREGPR